MLCYCESYCECAQILVARMTKWGFWLDWTFGLFTSFVSADFRQSVLSCPQFLDWFIPVSRFWFVFRRLIFEWGKPQPTWLGLQFNGRSWINMGMNYFARRGIFWRVKHVFSVNKTHMCYSYPNWFNVPFHTSTSLLLIIHPCPIQLQAFNRPGDKRRQKSIQFQSGL